MDVPQNWAAMMNELIGFIVAGDSDMYCYDWALDELQRVADYLDSGPRPHALPMAPAQEFARAKQELQSELA